MTAFNSHAGIVSMNYRRAVGSMFVLLATLGMCMQTALGRPGRPGKASTDVQAEYYLKAQQRVEVEPGRTLNLFCLGHGKPTILLDAGLGDTSLVWRQVQGTLSKSTRVCSFDRAGYGFSDAARVPSTVQSAADDMDALINHAGLGLPVLLVAHSLGGHAGLAACVRKATARCRPGADRSGLPRPATKGQ